MGEPHTTSRGPRSREWGRRGRGRGGVSGKGLPMGAKQRDQEVRDGSVDGKRPGSDNLRRD